MKGNRLFVESAMRNRQIVILAIFLLIVLGVFALVKMPRQEFPVVTIRQGLVIAAYPGATSQQVEEQLTPQVERFLYGYAEVNKKKTYSYSRDGLMIIFVELNDNVKNSDQVWSKLKDGLTLLKSQLPAGVLAIYADNDFGDTSALLISVEAENRSYRELEGYLYDLEDRLRQIDAVSKLRHYGLQKEQINVYLDKDRLGKYGITAPLLSASLFTHGLTAAGGSIDNGVFDAPVHVSSVYSTEEDLGRQIIYYDPNGNIVRLKDVATIVREYPDPDSYIMNNSKKALLISMEMLEGNNIVEFGEQVNTVLSDFRKQLPADVTISRIADQPEVVKKSVTTFLFELLFAILSVILVTMLLLPLRVASVAASSIPVTIFISLGLMYIFGIEINTVTLAALIVVLGMIVDNSVVIVDSYMVNLDNGMSAWDASVTSANGYIKAIFSATLAISITFFPFLFTLSGTFLDFVEKFPWTVTLTLGISLLIAVYVIPFVQKYFIRTGFAKNEEVKRFNMLNLIQSTYEKYLEKAFNKPRLTITIGILSIVLAAFIFRSIPLRLLPAAERNQFAVEIYLPQGSSLDRTAIVADSLKNMLKKDSRITSVTEFIGTSSPRFHATYAPNLPAKNYAQFIVNTTSARNTEDLLNELTPEYSDYFPEAHVRFKQIDYQPVSAPVEIRISGNDIVSLRTVADSLIPLIRSVEGITWVHSDFGEMMPSARIDINAIEANRIGIDKTIVSTSLAADFSGLPVTTIWENDYPVEVRLMTAKETGSVDELNDEYVHSLIPGVSVPLRQIATVNPDWLQGQVVRRTGIPTISILADIKRGSNVNNVFPSVRSIAESFNLPEGFTISYGGAFEKDSETIPGVMKGLFISIFMIFMILVLHFRKINLAILVLVSSALSLPGAFTGVLLTGVEFGITSILGIVSLIGILVRNGIIMLDYAEELRKKGLSVKEAAIEAGKRRMRPIFLTSAAASVGVIPMIISSNPLWSPMGAVICFGTLTAMILLVFILPVAYWRVFNVADKRNARLNGVKGSMLIVLLMLPAASAFSQNSYSLEQCRTLALENNTRIKNAGLEVQASQQMKKEAFTKYFPSISAEGMSFRLKKSIIDLDIPGGNLPVYDGNPVNLRTPVQFAYFPGFSLPSIDKGNMGALTAVQPVFAGGRIIAGNKLARVGVEASTGKSRLAASEVLLQTEEKFWQIVSLREKLSTLTLVSRLVDTLYHDADAASKAGLINKNEVLKVAMKKSELKSSRLKLENGIRLASMSLCQHIGIQYDENIIFTDSVTISEVPSDVYIEPEQALKDREEYRLLEKNVRAEELKTRMTLGEYLPGIGIGGSVMYYDIPDKGTFNPAVFATVSVPLSGWWGASHELKERKYREEIAKNDYSEKSELLLLQIRKSMNSLQEAYLEIEVAEETVSQAEENLKINADNYRSGIVNVSEMLQAQSLLEQAKNTLADAKSAYKLKLAEYL
ncbi:MAG TPA: efflux RND transporter permease subunit, partial [Bacteroidales bacterium]|nr:efflux RND transporter permease subunit [Bacteroidales bacterium]